MSNLTFGADAYKSDEFRAFALKWLGFDPKEEGVLKCVVELGVEEVVKVTLTKFGTEDMRRVYKTWKDAEIAKGMSAINKLHGIKEPLPEVVIDRESFLRD